MSFSATFYYDGGPAEGHEVLRFNHGFVQGTDDKGRPNTAVYGSMIGVRMVMTADSELAKWMLDPYDRRNARVVFKRLDQNSTFTETRFEQAYCMFYQDKLNARGGTEASAVIDVYLAPRRVIARGTTFDAGWEA